LVISPETLFKPDKHFEAGVESWTAAVVSAILEVVAYIAPHKVSRYQTAAKAHGIRTMKERVCRMFWVLNGYLS
jgi:hypothetical protein